jgi:alpha-amylase/alpha-mannosidase (GH57 family)
VADVVVAFLWHHHQPDYRDPRTHEALLPWTRLHGVKDYYAMAKIAAEFPGIKQNFNLVPSMLDQLLEIAAGGTDFCQKVSRKPADELATEEIKFVISEFFSANWNTMIEPFPRYGELLAMSGKKSGQPAHEACKRFNVQDLRDLQVWFNLAWFHPYSREKELLVADLIEKGGGFTEKEKTGLLDLQVKLLSEVVPLYRGLSESGQAELTTSPYYHPILPLLCDVGVAHEAMPGAPLPLEFPKAPEDALAHMRKALNRHEQLFGSRPRGVWPSEGSVSDDVVEILAQAGIEWCVTDEEILAATLSRSGKRIRLDGPDRAEMLYHGYRAESGDRSVNVIFRDHYLSDMIGFAYYTHEPKAAAADFVSHLHRIARLAAGKGGSTWIIPVVLDGENAWEAYPGGGLVFLRELYGLLSASDRVRTATISDYLAQTEQQLLEGLFAGSWIGHNFRIWIGEELNNKAWEYLGRTRKALTAAEKNLPEDVCDRAWEEIYKAEGSDWFWWYSEQHSSPHDEQFDALFLSHLASVYEEIGEEIPDFIREPIVQGRKPAYTEPYALLDVRIDGRRSDYFEWLCAGRYDPARDQGAMALSAGSAVKEIYYGFDLANFYLRMDFFKEVQELAGATLVVEFTEPRAVELQTGLPQSKTLKIKEDPEGGAVGNVAVDKFIELSIPFSELGIGQGQRAGFQVEFVVPGGATERLPFSGTIFFTSPTEKYEYVQWQV